MKRSCLCWMMVCLSCSAWAQMGTQSAAAPAAQEPAKAAATTSHEYEVTGTVVNAVSGDPLAKTTVSLTLLLDSTDDGDTAPGRRGNNADGAGQVGGRPGFNGGGAGGGQGGGPGANRFARGGAQNGRFQRANAQPQKTEVVTDANGHFEFEDVPAGRYSLFAQRKGFPRQSLERHAGFSTGVVVGADKNSKDIVIRIFPDSGIYGRVTDDFGDPVPNSMVALFSRNDDAGTVAVRRRSGTGTDAQGNYRFTHLTPGTYYVVISAQPWYTMYARMIPAQTDATQPEDGDANLDVAFPVTYFSGAQDDTNATPIQLQTGEQFEADMVLNTVQAMHLKVPTPTAQTPMMPQISTTVFGQEMPVSPMAMRFAGRPGANGQPEVTMTVAVAPGEYDMTLRTFNRPEGGGPLGQPTVVKKQTLDLNGDTVLDMSKGQDPAQVTGSVKFEGGSGGGMRGSVAFRKVGVTDNSSAYARTTPEGEIENFQLFPGHYTVSAGFRNYVIKSIEATGAKVEGRTIIVDGTAPIKVTLTMIRDEARVEGKVEVPEGKSPVSGAFVILVPQDMVNDAPNIRRFQSDTDGSFKFTSVIPGKYTVVAIREGWNLEWAKPEVMKPYLAKGEPLEVGVKGTFKVTVKAQ